MTRPIVFLGFAALALGGCATTGAAFDPNHLPPSERISIGSVGLGLVTSQDSALAALADFSLVPVEAQGMPGESYSVWSEEGQMLGRIHFGPGGVYQAEKLWLESEDSSHVAFAETLIDLFYRGEAGLEGIGSCWMGWPVGEFRPSESVGVYGYCGERGVLLKSDDTGASVQEIIQPPRFPGRPHSRGPQGLKLDDVELVVGLSKTIALARLASYHVAPLEEATTEGEVFVVLSDDGFPRLVVEFVEDELFSAGLFLDVGGRDRGHALVEAVAEVHQWLIVVPNQFCFAEVKRDSEGRRSRTWLESRCGRRRMELVVEERLTADRELIKRVTVSEILQRKRQDGR